MVLFLISSCTESTSHLLREEYETESYMPEIDVPWEYETSNGYMCRSGSVYYINLDSWINYYDVETGKSGVLCGKPECMHKDATCNAYTGVPLGQLQIYEGKIYWLANTTLFRADLDGNHREVVQMVDNMNGLNGRFFLQRGYLYTCIIGQEVVDGQSVSTIRCNQYILGNQDQPAKTLFFEEFKQQANYICRFVGNMMYFLVDTMDTQDIEMPTKEIYLYTYDISEDIWKETWHTTEPWEIYGMCLYEDEITVLSIQTDYMTASHAQVKLTKFDLEGNFMQEAENIELDSGYSTARIVDQYLIAFDYVNGISKYMIYDWEGNYIARGEAGYVANVMGMDENGLFLRSINGVDDRLTLLPMEDLSRAENIIEFAPPML